MDMVNNIEPLYSDKNALYDRWIEQGEGWEQSEARGEAKSLAAHFAEAIESMEGVDGRYSEREISEAAADMLREYLTEYRDEAIRYQIEQASKKPSPQDLQMSPGDVEHARKYDALAREIGIERVKSLIPVSPEKVRQVLSRGDKHLNSIPLRKWDQAALNLSLRERSLSFSDAFCVLKHVAKWHYA